MLRVTIVSASFTLKAIAFEESISSRDQEGIGESSLNVVSPRLDFTDKERAAMMRIEGAYLIVPFAPFMGSQLTPRVTTPTYAGHFNLFLVFVCFLIKIKLQIEILRLV